MIKSISVSNYALIDKLELSFGGSMNIITGETGAGKSVLMGALGLLLGDRADSSALSDAKIKCVIEGEFTSTTRAITFLEDSGLDTEEAIVIRREISKEGKSRSFINDTPVTLNQVRELGNLLVDIHSQHETLLLNQSNFQLSVVDAFAGNDKLLKEYKESYQGYRSSQNELKTLKEEERRSATEQDYLQFQLNELTEANLKAGEQKELERNLEVLQHAEEIRSGIDRFTSIISESEENIIGAINNAAGVLIPLGKFYPKLEESLKRIKALQIELKDIQYEVGQLGADIIINPLEITKISERLDLIYHLQHKHRADNEEQIILIRDEFESKLNSFSSLKDQVTELEKKIEKQSQKLLVTANLLSANRTKSASTIEVKIKKLLAELSMPDALLKVEITPLDNDEINSNGKDKVRFLFNANKGGSFSEISKVASGGELSRLMLAIKASVAKLISLPTIVFDEIDTGVSGETAFKIGKVMNQLSSGHQLIAITHLPQIASRGEDHFFVYKDVIGKKTSTKVRKLIGDERIVEIARMLSGDKPTGIAIENAKELLKHA